MDLYVEDYGEQYTASVLESPQPLTPNISSTPIAMSSASPLIQNLSDIVNSVVTPTIPSNPMWETIKDKIIQVLDQYTQSAVNVYKSMLAIEKESMGLEIIKSSLYDVYAKLFYQTICPTSHSATPTITYTPNHSVYENPAPTPVVHDLLQCIKDQSLSETRSIAESDATLTNEKNDTDIFEESVVSFPIDNASNVANIVADTTSVASQLETARVQLESSITRASKSFFDKLSEQRSSTEISSSSTSGLIETNPFKQDLLMSSGPQEMKIPPPLPPRPKKDFIKLLNYELFSAAPVLCDIPETISGESEEPIASGIKNVDPIDLANSSIPVYNNMLINPVGINKQRCENYDEDSWDSKSSYSICDPVDATTAESIEKDSSYSYNDEKSRSSVKSSNSIVDNSINYSSFGANREYSDSPNFKTVKLSDCEVDIYNFENSGWILVDQYRSAFTVYDDNKFILTMIKLKSVHVPVKKIIAEEYPKIFERYRKSNEKFIESNNDLDVLYLIPISRVLKLSYKLSVVTREEIEKIKSRNYDFQLSDRMIDLLRLMSSSEQLIKK